MGKLDNLILPAGITEEKDHIKIADNGYAAVYHLVVWPTDVYLGWLHELREIDGVDVSYYLFPLEQRYVCDELTKQITRAKSQWRLAMKSGYESDIPELEAVIQDFETLRRTVQRGYEKLFKGALIVTVRASTEDELKKKCEDVQALMAAKSARLANCYLYQLDAHKYSLPFMSYNQQNEIFTKTLSLGGAMAGLPVISDNLTHPNGIFVGFTGSGSPVLFNPFIGPKFIPNQHIAVFGTTGAGKSVTLKLLSSRLSLYGVKILILDWEGEYTKTVTNLMDGSVIKIDPSKPAGINPFDIELSEDEGVQIVNIPEKVADIRGLVSAVVRKFAERTLTAVEISCIEEAVRELYQNFGITKHPDSLYVTRGKTPDGRHIIGRVKKQMPTFSNFLDVLAHKKGAENLAVELQIFKAGNSLGFFDCQSSITYKDTVSFDLSKISDEFTKFYAMYVILNWAWHNFVLRDPSPKMIVNDEAWMFMKYPESAEFLETLARRGRKKNVSLVVASQYIQEFLNNDQGKAIIASCATRFLLGQESTVVNEVISAFKLPPSLNDFLSRARKGACLMTVNNVTSQVFVKVLPYEEPFVHTNPAG